jgi:membrane protease YdiL (CAAX protease family)
MSLTDAAVSAVLQAGLLGGVPLLGYMAYQKLRHRRTFKESARRSGLQVGNPRYLVYSLAFALAGVGLVTFLFTAWPTLIEPLTREGSAQRQFVGLGFSLSATALAFFNGVVQTGFAEELLFRGLIAGSLSRHLPLLWANLVQALIFLVPHFLILLVMPKMWPVLPLVFLGALTFGWVRIKSGSILGSWLMHGTGNVTMALIVAVRTSA